MTQANCDIRSKAKEKGVRMWEIADKLGLLDCNFSRKLRHEFDASEKEKIISIIEEIASQKEKVEE